MPKITACLLLFALLCQHNVFSQEKDLSTKFDQYVRPYVETKNFSGRVLVSQKGKILFNKAYGVANLEFGVPSDPNTIFQIASLSKPFTAASILILEQKGLLKTEDLLSKYIPDFLSSDKITLHHLLSHTSGITEINDLPEYVNASLTSQTPETLVALLKNKPLEFQPGEKWAYSNSNYAILALVIEQVSKNKYGDFLKENIFKPLGMDHTSHRGNMTRIIDKMAEGYYPDGNFGLQKAPYLDWSAKTGSGSLVSTADDLEKWNKALLGTTILSDKSKTKMFTEYGDSGYGWYLQKKFDKNLIFMNGRGPGFCAYIGRYPEEEACIIVLSNIQLNAHRQIAIDLAGILFNQPVETPTFNKAKMTDEQVKQLIGKYKFGKDFYKPDFTLEVTAVGSNISSNYGELIYVKPLEFIQRSYWLKTTFTKDATGRINGMTIDNYKGERVE